MAQDPEVVSRPGTPAPQTTTPAPEPAVDIDAKVRERYKADFGVEDAEEIKRWRAEADEGRQYKQAFAELQRRAQIMQQGPRGPQPQPGQRPQGPDLNRLREYGRIDPVGAYLELERYKDSHYNQRMAALEQRTVGALEAREYQAAEVDAERYVRNEFPEAYDRRTALHQEGLAVYQSMPELQRRGDGFRIATEIAAARKGLLPKSMRRSEPTVERDDVAAQTIERGTKRPPKDGEGKEDVKLNDREKKWVDQGLVDAKTLKAAKAARAAGKSVRVE